MAWDAATYSAGSKSRGYIYEVDDLTDGGAVDIEDNLPGPRCRSSSPGVRTATCTASRAGDRDPLHRVRPRPAGALLRLRSPGPRRGERPAGADGRHQPDRVGEHQRGRAVCDHPGRHPEPQRLRPPASVGLPASGIDGVPDQPGRVVRLPASCSGTPPSARWPRPPPGRTRWTRAPTARGRCA